MAGSWEPGCFLNPTWLAEHLLSFVKSGFSGCVAGCCSHMTNKISVKILGFECEAGFPGLHTCFCILLLG